MEGEKGRHTEREVSFLISRRLYLIFSAVLFSSAAGMR